VGYNYSGWNTASGGGGTAYAAGQVISPWLTMSNLTLYAQWQAKTGIVVTFDSSGGSAASPASKTVTFGSAYGTLATTARTGHVFDGWFTESSGGTQVTLATNVNNENNHTLYAHWHARNNIVLTFDKNAANATAGAITQWDDLVYGQTLTAQGKTLPDAGNGAPKRTGYDFAGWATTQTLANAGTPDFTDQ